MWNVPHQAEGTWSSAVTLTWCSACRSCCCPMICLLIPLQSYSEWLPSSCWCFSSPRILQFSSTSSSFSSCSLTPSSSSMAWSTLYSVSSKGPSSSQLWSSPQHLPSCQGHEFTLEKLQLLCLDRGTSNAVCIPENSTAVILLLLQMDSCETWWFSLLPGLFDCSSSHKSKGDQFWPHWWMPCLPHRGCICASVGWGLPLCRGNSLTSLGQVQATCVQQLKRKILPLAN